MPTSTEALKRQAAIALIALFSLTGCGEESDGLEKYPVQGSVLVNGKPVEMMAVTFHNSDANAPGNAGRPVAVTDAEGRFILSTNADKDGAIPGEYLVTFFWSSENGPSAYDRLGGRFNNPKSSSFKVQVGRKENDLEPFKLEVDAKALKPARKTQAVPQ